MIITIIWFISVKSLCVTPPYVPFQTMKHSWSKKPSSSIPNCRPFHPSEKPSCANSLLSPTSCCSYLPL